MRLLDLYCGAEGSGKGYQDAGYTITGIDIINQPNYPGEFIQADAIEYLLANYHKYDIIHASPPCQFASTVKELSRARNNKYGKHINLIPDTKKAILETKLPYVIENVPGARKYLDNPIMLCGKYFGLKVYRHRLFESNIKLAQPPHEKHRDSTPSAGNGKSKNGFISVCGTGGIKGMNSKQILEYWSYAMGIYWMTRKELSQAIPPKYTEFIGRQIIQS